MGPARPQLCRLMAALRGNVPKAPRGWGLAPLDKSGASPHPLPAAKGGWGSVEVDASCSLAKARPPREGLEFC